MNEIAIWLCVVALVLWQELRVYIWRKLANDYRDNANAAIAQCTQSLELNSKLLASRFPTSSGTEP